MELADAVPTAGLDPTNTTWAQVQAMGQAKSAAEWKYTRDVEGSIRSAITVSLSAAEGGIQAG